MSIWVAVVVMSVSTGASAQDSEPGNNTAVGASSLDVAQGEALMFQGTLVPDDDDYYSVEMTEGQVLTIMTTPLGDDFDVPDTLLFLFDTDGTTLIDENDDAGDDLPEGGEFGSVIRFRAPADGTYPFAVTGYPDLADHDESGPYALTVSLATDTAITLDTDPSNDTPSGADQLLLPLGDVALIVGELVESGIGLAGDVDFYAVSLEQGQVLSVVTTPFGRDLDDPDTELGVFQLNGTALLINDDAPDEETLGSALRFRAPSAGVYYIGVSAYDDGDDGVFDGDHGDSGEYALTLSIVSEGTGSDVSDVPTASTLSLALLGLLLAGVGYWSVGRLRG